MAVIDLIASNFLAIFGTLNQPPAPHEFLNQSLTIAQTAHCSKQYVSLNQPLSLGQAVSLTRNANVSASNQLVVAQVMGRSTQLFAGNNLILTQQAASVNPQIANNILVITQVASPSRARISNLTVTQVVAVVLTKNSSFSNSLSLLSNAVAIKVDAVNTYNITIPALIDSQPIVFTCGSESITLKVPEIGDNDKIELSRVQEQTRAGDLIIFSDPDWPKTEILKYKFIGLSRGLSGQFLNFLHDTIGQQIDLIDYQGQNWQGIILTPEAERICSNDRNCGSYEIEIEFQGVKV